MRIVALTEQYVPKWNAGASVMLHEILVGLRARGHAVDVYVDRIAETYTIDGIAVEPLPKNGATAIFASADVLLTHQASTSYVSESDRRRYPIAYIAHVDGQEAAVRLRPDHGHLVIFNSETMADRSKWSGRSLVCPPPVSPSRYETPRGDRITLVNLNENKGGQVFWKIARALPTHEFLGVEGAYHRQIVERGYSNVEIMRHTPDAREIYARTRILLVPSQTESYGRVAIEAAISGIPVLAHPTPGLREALGPAGIYIDRSRPDHYAREILRLDDPDEYAAASAAVLERARELDPEPILDRLETALEEYADDFAKMLARRHELV